MHLKESKSQRTWRKCGFVVMCALDNAMTWMETTKVLISDLVRNHQGQIWNPKLVVTMHAILAFTFAKHIKIAGKQSLQELEQQAISARLANSPEQVSRAVGGSSKASGNNRACNHLPFCVAPVLHLPYVIAPHYHTVTNKKYSG